MQCTRMQLVHIGRRMLELDLVVGSFGNASCRKANQILITPTSLDYTKMQPEDIVTIDLDGRKIAGTREPSSEFRMHLAIYRFRPDVQAIVHTHSLYAIAFSLARNELPMLTEELTHVVGSVPVSGYAKAGTEELAKAAASSLGQEAKAVILGRHGVVGVGNTPEEALLRCKIVERGAKIYLASRSLGWKGEMEE